MRRSSRNKAEHGLRPCIAHRDVTGKAFVLLLVFALALGAIYFAGRVPPRPLTAPRNVVNAEDKRSERVQPASAVKPAEIKVLGLDYLLPHPRPSTRSGAAVGSALDVARDAGRLRGYSLPPRRLAFTPSGGAVILPPSQLPAGPRQPVLLDHGTRHKKRVALTFDTSDVAEPKAAKAVLDELTRLRAPATLFVCGAWCYKNPELLRLAVSRGFEIGNHSSTHPDCTKIPNEVIVNEIKGTEKAVRDVTGVSISGYFRPPYGSTDARVEQVAADCGYATVLWSIDTLDWEPDTIREQIRDRATVGTRDGDIILMHTLGRYTPDALVEVVTNLRANGFELTTLSGVLQP